MMTEHGRFHWNERMTRDLEGVKRFYADALGWRHESMAMPDGTYWVAMAGDAMVAGIFDISGDAYGDVPETWFAYIAVDDVDARCGRARAAGAAIVREPWDVPNVGRIAILREPAGATIGWMTPTV
jgi:predicted enzyme related to lactoylglutathione lyase